MSHATAEQKFEPVILIANSDPSARDWIEATVRSTGLRTASFDSGSELLSRFDAQTTACAILDLALPDASAFDIQEKLSRSGAAVMFLTRERSISSCVRAIKAGAVDFLTLPCDAIDLVRALRTAVSEAVSAWARRQQLHALRAKFEHLTRREREIFALVSTGIMNKQVADRLDISEITVQIHRGRVMRKMGARTFAGLVRMADELQVTRQAPGADPVFQASRAPASSFDGASR
jgi:FixJ family two-component response regulator